jgi:hypothetical protein
MGLSSRYVATLNAAADRIIPPDDGTPGAIDSGAAANLVTLLEAHLRALLPDYQAFLAQLDLEAEVMHGPRFAALSTDQQDALLQTFQMSPFFRLFAEHVHEQFWSSPAGLKHAGFEVRG